MRRDCNDREQNRLLNNQQRCEIFRLRRAGATVVELAAQFSVTCSYMEIVCEHIVPGKAPPRTWGGVVPQAWQGHSLTERDAPVMP